MKGNVLIVDDSLTVRMDLADAFETVGLRPLLCSTIREARETFTVETIDLVILDVMLPDGDGVEFLKEIRTRLATPDLPILMLSGEAEVKTLPAQFDTQDRHVWQPIGQRVPDRLDRHQRLTKPNE